MTNDIALISTVLAEILYPHLLSTEDFGKFSQFTEKTLRAIGSEAVRIDLERMDGELFGQVPKEWKVLERPKRTLITLLGEVTYKRRVYLDEFGSRRYLLDEILGIKAYGRIEANAFLWIVRRSADVSFEKTAKEFFDKTGARVTRTTVMRCVHKEGELLEQAEKPAVNALSTPVVFAEFDGFWVNIQVPVKGERLPRRTYKEQFKKTSREMKVWVAYAGTKDSKRVRPMHWASKSEPEEFFKECMTVTGGGYDLSDIEYLSVASDGASWCKHHTLEEHVGSRTVVVSKLDTFHVNQKVYRAFSSEDDRSAYLGFLYSKNFNDFFDALEKRIEDEPGSEKTKARIELRDYISNNIDWLDGMTLSKHIRETLITDLLAVFGDRPFYGYLRDLLAARSYKRFISVLEKIVDTCAPHLRYDYENYLDDARCAIKRIELYRPTKLGSMEGTNAKVYAARLKVWGCAWSERGAIAMMRIRATIASGLKLVAPNYNSWLSETEKQRIETSRRFNHHVSESEGDGYEPPQGSLVALTRLAPKIFGTLNFSTDPLPAWCN